MSTFEDSENAAGTTQLEVSKPCGVVAAKEDAESWRETKQQPGNVCVYVLDREGF